MGNGDAVRALKKPQQLSRGVIKTVAGMAVTSPREMIKLAAHNGDQLLKGEFSQALHDTYAFFVNNGQIDPKYFDSTKFADLAPEFGRVYREAYGVEKLDKLRKVFANLAKDNGADSYKKYLLDIALDMSEPEIKVLIGDYELARRSESMTQDQSNELRASAAWLREIAVVTGLKHISLVVNAENSLVDRGLLSGRILGDSSGTEFLKGNGRLTSTGKELCSLMTLNDDPID